jgi:hypothetical protein
LTDRFSTAIHCTGWGVVVDIVVFFLYPSLIRIWAFCFGIVGIASGPQALAGVGLADAL